MPTPDDAAVVTPDEIRAYAAGNLGWAQLRDRGEATRIRSAPGASAIIDWLNTRRDLARIAPTKPACKWC